MTIEDFDKYIRDASIGVNFGPLNGFGGRGSNKVLNNLPENVRKAFKALDVPVAILAGNDSGHLVRFYAESIGKDVVKVLSKY